MRRYSREMHIDDYEAWSAAQKRHDAVVEAADEEGGPRLSLVPQPERGEVWPTDLLPAPREPAAEAAERCGVNTDVSPPAPATPLDGVALQDSRKRLIGWSADR